MKRAYHQLQTENEYLKQLTSRLFKLHETLMDQCSRDQDDRRILMEVIHNLEQRLPSAATYQEAATQSRPYQQASQPPPRYQSTAKPETYQQPEADQESVHIAAYDLFESCDSETVVLPSGHDFDVKRGRSPHLSGLFMGKRKVQGDVWHQHSAIYEDEGESSQLASGNDFTEEDAKKTPASQFFKTNGIS